MGEERTQPPESANPLVKIVLPRDYEVATLSVDQDKREIDITPFNNANNTIDVFNVVVYTTDGRRIAHKLRLTPSGNISVKVFGKKPKSKKPPAQPQPATGEEAT